MSEFEKLRKKAYKEVAYLYLFVFLFNLITIIFALIGDTNTFSHNMIFMGYLFSGMSVMFLPYLIVLTINPSGMLGGSDQNRYLTLRRLERETKKNRENKNNNMSKNKTTSIIFNIFLIVVLYNILKVLPDLITILMNKIK